jgi:hypothetical protein
VETNNLMISDRFGQHVAVLGPEAITKESSEASFRMWDYSSGKHLVTKVGSSKRISFQN